MIMIMLMMIVMIVMTIFQVENGWETLNRREDGSLRGDDGKVGIHDDDNDSKDSDDYDYVLFLQSSRRLWKVGICGDDDCHDGSNDSDDDEEDYDNIDSDDYDYDILFL